MCRCGKRRFSSIREVDRALGRTRAKRIRRAESKRGTRRGLVVEHRYYACPAEDGVWHLTHLNHGDVAA